MKKIFNKIVLLNIILPVTISFGASTPVSPIMEEAKTEASSLATKAVCVIPYDLDVDIKAEHIVGRLWCAALVSEKEVQALLTRIDKANKTKALPIVIADEKLIDKYRSSLKHISIEREESIDHIKSIEDFLLKVHTLSTQNPYKPGTIPTALEYIQIKYS
jgi:hypothetical protein